MVVLYKMPSTMADIRESDRLRPKTEPSQKEVALAQELRGMIDGFLGEAYYRSFDFQGRNIFDLSTPARSWFPSRKGSLLNSPEWPDLIPTGQHISAHVSRDKAGVVYTIEATNQFFHGVRFTLQGNHPLVNIIMPESSPQAETPEDRPWEKTSIKAKDCRLRPRIKRLEYGIFLLIRIKEADSGVEVLS